MDDKYLVPYGDSCYAFATTLEDVLGGVGETIATPCHYFLLRSFGEGGVSCIEDICYCTLLDRTVEDCVKKCDINLN